MERLSSEVPASPLAPLAPADAPPMAEGSHEDARPSVRLRLMRGLAASFPTFVGNRLRMALLRAGGLRIGRGTIMWGAPVLIGASNLHELLSIGEDCGFNVGCFFEVEAPITIGNHVGVGHDVMFLTRGYEQGPGAQRAGRVIRAPIVIEDGAWLGARCTILPGVTVGAGSVIGAGMVIGKDVPPNTLLMGTQKISLARWR